MFHFSNLRALALSVFSAALIPAVLVLNLGVQNANAQVTVSSIHGTVTDQSDAVVPGAKVTALNTATGISVVATTDHSGYYLFTSLQPGGPYTITVEASGFNPFATKGITLAVNANWDADAKLTVGASQTSVTVDASGGVQVETSNTQLEQDINSDQIENLPLLGRDASGLQKLAPGAVESSDRFGNYSTNGSQTTSNSFLLNGADINDGPLQSEGLSINPDALQEENIVSSTLNPEFARNGGAVINQVIKAGSNHIHGSGFEYYRDTFLNNGNYFSQDRPPFHQNLFGGTLGGPILKDRLFLFLGYQGFRNRTGSTTQTSVFRNGVVSDGDFSLDNNVALSGANSSTGLSGQPIPFVITTASGNCGPGTAAPNWSDCYPAGTPVVIPTSNFNPIALKLAQTYVPAGNSQTSSGSPLFNFNTADTGAADQGILRADYHLGQSDTLWGSFIFQSSPSTATLPFGGATLPGFGMVDTEHFKIASASYTHTFSPTLLNELRAGYYRLNYAAVSPATPVAPSSVGFNITPQSSASGLPNIDLTGLFTLGFSFEGPQPRKDTNISGSDILSKQFGNHSLKFGATIEQFRVSNPYYADNNGVFGFGGSGQYSSGDPAIDYLLGIPDTYTQTSGGFVDAESWEYYAFAQDSWKLNSDLTVNYGLAWDVETPNTNNQFGGEGISCFQVSSATSKIFPGGFPGLLFPGDPGCNRQGGATTKYAHFGPRFGLAWSPSHGPAALLGTPGSHDFVIRAGFGLYYNRDQEEGQLQNLGDVPNFKESIGAADFGGSPSFADPFTDVAGGGSETNPFPFVRPTAGTQLDWSNYLFQDISAIDPGYSTPYIYNFNLNIQRELPGNMILQVGYVGSLGRRLATIHEADPITPAGHAACLANPDCVANRSQQHLLYPENTAQPATTDGYPDFISVGALATQGSSSYHSLQASLNKNFSHGLYFTLAYTFSHGLDNASGLESSGFGAKSINNFAGYQYLSYGDSDYDSRHRLVASYDYTVPLPSALNGNYLVKELLGGWHFNGVTALQTGFPVNVAESGVFNSLWCDGYSYYGCPDTPNTSSFRIPSMNIRKTGSWFDGSATGPFSSEPIGTFGNVKRNFFHGPGYNYSNLSVYKILPLGRDSARSIQIALQASNAFNHANFDAPDSNFSDGPGLFGAVTAVKATADVNGDPSGGRTVQLVGKFRF